MKFLRLSWWRRKAHPITALYDDLLKIADDGALPRLLTSMKKLAREMKHGELRKWADLETDGYIAENRAMDDSVQVPKYRWVPGRRLDEYGRPLLIQDPGMHFLNTMPLRQGVAELERLARRSGTLTGEDPVGSDFIRERFQTDVRWFEFAPESITGVLASIRSEAIEWLYKIRPEVDALRAPGRGVHFGPLAQAASHLDAASLHEHIRRIEQGLDSDPDQAIGSAKDLAETVAKHVLEQYGEDPARYDTLPRLVKAALGKLDLHSDAVTDPDKGAIAMKMLIGGLGTTIEAVAALRNLYGTGHGRTRLSGAQARHARAVVAACATLATFMLETLQARRGKP